MVGASGSGGIDDAVASAWQVQLALRASGLRRALQATGADAALAERLAPLQQLTRPGRDPSLSASEAADECAQLLSFSLANVRALSLRHEAVVWDGPATLAQMPCTSPLLLEVLRAVLQAVAEAGAYAHVESLCRWIEQTSSRGVLEARGIELADTYDRFLQHYDPVRRRAGGVYFTPPALVDFMWEQVRRVLVGELGRPAGLEDPELSLLDPCVGGGAFLGALCDRLPPEALVTALSSRVHGFEVMLPAYAACHMRLTSRALASGSLAAGQPLPRIDVCLASALAPPDRLRSAEPGPDGLARAIRAEAAAARRLHDEVPIDVVVGNPPYRRSSENRHPVIDQRMGPYKAPLVEEPNLQPLSDDYVKFFRRLEVMLGAREPAVLCLVTPSTYLGGRLHRGMRASLLTSFSRVDLLDLHGSARGERPAAAGRRPATPGERDENVFGVGQGIAVAVLSRGGGEGVRHAELVGSRDHKLGALRADRLEWASLEPVAPDHLLTPRAPTRPDYRSYLPLPALFGAHSVAGKPGDDATLVSFEREQVIPKLERARAELSGAAGLGRRTEAMQKLARRPAGVPFDAERVRPYAYRPFDERFVYDDPALWTRPVRDLRERIDGQPLLWSSRVVKDPEFAHVFVSRILPDVIGLSPTSSVNCHVFPQSTLRADVLTGRLGAKYPPEVCFAYVYAVLHSPGYRRRHAGALRGDYPRIPQPSDPRLFEQLALHGSELLGLHLADGPPLRPGALRFVDGGDRAIARVAERGRKLRPLGGGAVGRLHINDVSYFEPLAECIWRHRIGGYQVCFKWLHDRRRAGRRLGDADVQRFLQLAAAIQATRQVSARIERSIRMAGGWPRAFS